MKGLTLHPIAVDVFRALTMFLMLFVNDIPGLKNVPHWLTHQDGRRHDGILRHHLPCFPFLHGHVRILCHTKPVQKGDNTLQVVAHIFWRTVALDAMGLFPLNSGGIEGGLSHPWFSILMGHRFLPHLGYIPKR